MEGLIPMVYKTIKKIRTRRHYEYLGSGAGAGAGAGAAVTEAQSHNNNADFHTNKYDDHYMTMNGQYAADLHQKKNGDGFNNIKGHHHRRYKSFHVDYQGGFSPEDNTTAQSKKLVRFRSHKFFSCVTGA